jgi:hypothetical protein
VRHHIPNLARAIVGRTQEQVTGFGEKLDALDATVMT